MAPGAGPAAETELLAAEWDRWHRQRDALEQDDQLPILAMWRELAIRRLPDMHGVTAIDCGSARGGFSRVLAELGADVTAIDSSNVAVELTRLQLGAGRGRSLQADACRLPFPDDTFDVGVCLQTVNHVTARRLVLSGLVRVTKPAGRIIVTASNRLSPFAVSGAAVRLIKRRPEEHPPGRGTVTIPNVLRTLRALEVEIDAIDGDTYGFLVPGYKTVRLKWLGRLPKSHYLAFHVCIAGTVRNGA